MISEGPRSLTPTSPIPNFFDDIGASNGDVNNFGVFFSKFYFIHYFVQDEVPTSELARPT
jgi:hypothetical protein